MRPRYQVFLSSTFADLQDERKEVLSALQKAGYFVAGMELFPSDDDESWEVIKKVIDQSDYYVLVIGGRYGSLGKDGKSFTEMEYDYAKARKLPALVFVHADPTKLPHCNVESSHPEKLTEFRSKVEKNHNRRTWSDKHGLALEVVTSISQSVNLHPQVGWVRGTVADEKSELDLKVQELQQAFDLVRAERDALKSQLESQKAQNKLQEIAWGDDEVEIVFNTSKGIDNSTNAQIGKLSVQTTWKKVFRAISPLIVTSKSTYHISAGLSSVIGPNLLEERMSASATSESLNIIRVQLLALDLIDIEIQTTGGINVFTSLRTEVWRLTEKGLREYASANAMRRATDRN